MRTYSFVSIWGSVFPLIFVVKQSCHVSSKRSGDVMMETAIVICIWHNITPHSHLLSPHYALLPLHHKRRPTISRMSTLYWSSASDVARQPCLLPISILAISLPPSLVSSPLLNLLCDVSSRCIDMSFLAWVTVVVITLHSCMIHCTGEIEYWVYHFLSMAASSEYARQMMCCKHYGSARLGFAVVDVNVRYLHHQEHCI